MGPSEHEMNVVFLDTDTIGADIALEPLGVFGPLKCYGRTKRDQGIDRIATAEIVVTNKVAIGAEEMEAAPSLKLIALTATGVNNVDIDAARRLGIAVANVAGYSTSSVAQHTFALLLSLLGRIAYHDSFVKNGDYSRSELFTHLDAPFTEIEDKRWGIIGLGAIGRAVAQRAEAFGCEVSYFSASGKTEEPRYRRLGLHTLLERSDIVSVHCPLTDRTRGLIGPNELERMKAEAVILNLARGGIIDEAALVSAVDAGRIAGAAVDVYETEPPPASSPLLNARRPERLVLTPHTAWASYEARVRLIEEVAANIRAFLDGKRRNRVD